MTLGEEYKFAAVFDMDGVLLDSPKLNWQANNEVLARYGITIPVDKLHLYVGHTLKDTVMKLNETYNLRLDYEDFRAQTDVIKKELFENIQPKEGVKELLEVLSSRNVPLAVATSMPRDLTEKRLTTAGIIDFFDALVTEDDVLNHKPNPEVFLKAASCLGVSPSVCVVFEDAPAGLQAARAAGMKCVAIKTDFVPEDKLKDAFIVVDSMTQINYALLESAM